MATYPGGVKTFTAKQDGIDYPQASHINDLQAEVTAVEDALINGISHAVTLEAGLTVSTGPVVVGQSLSVAGGSTLAGAVVISSGLSVAGGSTLASLDVAGNSTFHGPVTFSSGVTFIVPLPLNPPRVRVHITADQDLPASAWTGISWPAEDYDSHAMHSTAVNSSRITFVDSSGVYHIGACVDITNPSSGAFRVRILLGDSTAAVVAANGFFANVLPNTGLNSPVAVSADVRIADTATYATVQVFNGHGTSTNSVTSTGSFVTAFWAHKVSS
jgi:hypothetical protein